LPYKAISWRDNIHSDTENPSSFWLEGFSVENDFIVVLRQEVDGGVGSICWQASPGTCMLSPALRAISHLKA
jgi:hypothetical protein